MTNNQNLRKAAVLLMSLPPDDAARLLSLLEPAMVEAVSVEIARTERVSGSEQDAVAEQFSEAQPVDGSEGGLHVARALLERALGERAGETIDHVRQTVEPPPLDFLQAMESDRLLSLVRNEQPQTIALILLHMAPARRNRTSPRALDRAAMVGDPANGEHESRRSGSRPRGGVRAATRFIGCRTGAALR